VNAVVVRLRRFAPSLTMTVAFVASLVVYLSNGETISSYDAVPNSLLAFDVLAAHRLDFDSLRNGYFVGLGGQYAFVEAPNGHLSSLFPIGTAIVTAPIYSVLYVARAAASQPIDISSPAFEPVRLADEKLAAAIVAALAVALFFACARSLAGPVAAALATAAFAFGTQTWMIGSQGLWQHGSVELVLLGMIAALLQATRSEGRARTAWLLVAGACMGLLPVVRPTAIVFAVAGLAFAATWFGRRALPAGAGALLGIAPGVAWNLTVFHSLVGGYAADAQAYTNSFGAAAGALAALVISPSRGILVFTPLVVLSAVGLARAAREDSAPARLLTLLSMASLLLIASYAFYAGWIGGDAYGPRFLTDCMPVAMLLLAYVVPASTPALVACAAALVWSIGVQAAGAFSGAAGPVWNEIPIALAYAPDRVWQLADSQIERNVRATYYHYVPDYPTGGPQYTAEFAGRVTAVTRSDGAASEPLASRPGEALALTASLQNTGRSTWFGYASAVYNKEARVRARIVDARGRRISEQQLYVEGNVAPGAQARAIGMLSTPKAAGAYTLQCDVVALGVELGSSAPQPLRVPLNVGERPAAAENTGVSP